MFDAPHLSQPKSDHLDGRSRWHRTGTWGLLRVVAGVPAA